MSDVPVCHCRVHFEGRVQGVGFRYQALQVARGYTIAGYVQNLTDGRVRLEAEGEEEEVRRFVAEVRRRLAPHIRRSDEAFRQANRTFRGFDIR